MKQSGLSPFVSLCFENDLLLAFGFFQLPCWSCLELFSIPCPLQGLCPAPSSLGLVLSSASTTQAYFVLRFPILRWASPLLFIGILQGIAAGIGTSNFLQAAFIVSLNSLSFGPMKNILLNCLALTSFGFSIAHLCFAFFFAASDINFHISGHTSSGREVVCFLVSLSPDHVYPSGALSFSRTNLVNLVHVSADSLSPSTIQSSSIFFPNNTSSDVYVDLVTSMYFIGIVYVMTIY